MKTKSIEDYIPNDSWLKQWMQCWPLSESPRSFILLAGMSALGAAVGRECWLELDYRRLYPMLNLVLAGPSGLGKTEACDMASLYLFKAIPHGFRQPLIMTGETTYPKLVENLEGNGHAVVIAEEMAAFFTRAKYQEDLIPFVTKLLNYPETVERDTKSEGLKVIKTPEVTFMCGTTPEWLQNQIPNTAVAGGFLPRFLIAYEEHKSQFIPIPELRMSPSKRALLQKHREDAVDAFLDLIAVKGRMEFRDVLAMNTFEIWLTNHKPATGHLAPFSARAREFVLRLAMILALSCDRRKITEDDITNGAGIYEWAIERLQQVVVPCTQEGALLNKVLDVFTTSTSPLSERQIKRAMRNYMRADTVIKNIESLMQSGDITRLPSGKYKRVYGRDREETNSPNGDNPAQPGDNQTGTTVSVVRPALPGNRPSDIPVHDESHAGVEGAKVA